MPSAKATILCYGMGLTQHRSSSSTVQQLVNLLLLKGNIGRPGAGICPLRGHSNVQGDRTVGIWEKPSAAFLDSPWTGVRLQVAARARPYGGRDDRGHGGGRGQGVRRPGRQFRGRRARSDPDLRGDPKAGLTVHVATKLNRTHLLHGAEAMLLPCLGRTEIDLQAGGRQAVTVEDSMSMVHASRGLNPPASEQLKSEPAIVAGIGAALFGPRIHRRLAGAGRRLRQDPRPDRGGLPGGLRRL
jgi:anaerobic selenocysteine-containing dehydrogenase